MYVNKENMIEWYNNRIEQGEMSLSGWTSRKSQTLRFDATLRMIKSEFHDSLPVNVVDYGCGTAAFYFYGDRKYINRYIGIEIRSEAREQASRAIGPEALIIDKPSEPPDGFSVDAIVANGNFGFAEQDIVSELKSLADIYAPRAMIVDVFSTFRPYEPEDPVGYVAYNPYTLISRLRKGIDFRRWSLDHSYLGHVFTFGLFK